MRRVALAAFVLALAGCARGPAPLVVASKPFTESEIVGEMIAQLAEADGVKVERRMYLGGQVCFEGVKHGDIDLYVEYTGTGLVNILALPPSSDKDAVFKRVSVEFKKRWGLTWLPRLGFNNTYAFVVRKADVAKYGTESGVTKAKGVRCGFDLEFADRPDGYKGLLKRVGHPFCAQLKQMASGLMYDALAKKQVDVISGYSTDGRIASLGLAVLPDDLDFFPPYEAAPLAGPKAFTKDPELRARLEALGGRISNEEMTRLNGEVVAGKMNAREAARRFLVAKGLLGPKA
ncbi:MAG: glycine/betaine ABC transporter substrate-binding protein [Elusimicrobia bacterium]|nr:glycine/betaine ABC transporter substrate-binding protein [Elusimicrobiota bacterium]